MFVRTSEDLASWVEIRLLAGLSVERGFGGGAWLLEFG